MITKERVFWGIMLVPFLALALPPEGWRGAIPIVEATNQQTEPAVASKDDSVFVAWIDARTTPKRVYFKRSANKGFTWQNEVLISESDNVSGFLSVAIDENSQWTYLLWTSGTASPYSLKFARSSDRGQTWVTPVLTLAENLTDDPCNSIYVTDNGDVHIAYYKRTGSDYNWLRYAISTTNGSSFNHYDAFDVNSLSQSYRVRKTTITTAINEVQIISTINYYYSSQLYVYHTHGSPGSFSTYQIDNYLTPWNKRPIAMTSDQNGDLHLCRSTPLSAGSAIAYRKGHFNSAWNWSDTMLLHAQLGTGFPSIVVYSSNLQVIFTTEGFNGQLHHSLSTDLGETWVRWKGKRSRQIWDYAINLPSISAGPKERHVVCTSYGGDIHYLANDDVLVSGSPYATSYNWGRHLIRIAGDELELVYMSEFGDHYWIIYSSSPDGTDHWRPYQQLRYTPVPEKGYGKYPTISHGFFPFEGEGVIPPGYTAVAYLSEDEKKIFYRRYDAETQTWFDPIEVYSAPSGNYLDPPTITAVEETVFVLFAENSLTESWIKCYWFKYDGSGIKEKDVQQWGIPDYLHAPSVYHDGNKHLHAVWKEGNDIEYARRVWGQPYWDQYFNVSNSSVLSEAPHIEVWGDVAYAAWTEHITGVDIFMRRKFITSNTWDRTPHNVSQSAMLSQYVSQSKWWDVWQEPPSPPNGHYDIRYGAWGWWNDWVWQSGVNSCYPHSAFQQTPTGIWLYTIWTEDSIPYEILSDKRFIDEFGGDLGYYSVETGNPDPSPYLIQREGIKNYGNHKIDYDPKDLIYELSFLDPRYDYYLIAGSYHEGLPRKETWFIDGELVGEFAFQPNKPETVMVQIPYKSYVKDRKVKVAFKNVSGSFAAKAGLMLLCVDHKQQGGGGQSGGPQLPIASKLSITPNPTKGRLSLNFSLGNPSLVRINLYDLTGRKVATVHNDNLSTGDHKLTTDLSGNLSSGVYFLTLEAEGKNIVEKIVLRR